MVALNDAVVKILSLILKREALVGILQLTDTRKKAAVSKYVLQR